MLHATASATILVPNTSQARDLDALAAAVRDEQLAVALAASDMLEHALRAGDALILAKTQVPEGHWQQFRDRCGLKERTDRAYRELAANRAALEPHRQHAAGLSIRAALRLLGSGRARPVKPKAVAKKSIPPLKVLAAIGWWIDAPIADRRRFLDGVGRCALDAATPPSWRQADIAAASSGELARLTAQVEELQREIRERDLVIEGLQRQLGKPVEDAFHIPEFLQA